MRGGSTSGTGVFSRSLLTARGGADAASPRVRASGRCTRSVAPRSGTLSIEMKPPARRTIDVHIARPRPVPSPSDLVVKNGSNARSCRSRLMPRPSSETVSTRNVPSLNRPRLRAWSASITTSPVDTRTQCPKPRVASTALPTRFSSTWRSCVRIDDHALGRRCPATPTDRCRCPRSGAATAAPTSPARRPRAASARWSRAARTPAASA